MQFYRLESKPYLAHLRSSLSKQHVMWRTAVLLISILLLCKSLFAQKLEVSFDKLTVESGLSQSSVISITQDSMGFMWFGAKDGLNRYDSRTFEVFRNNPKDSTSLSSDQNINALLTDSKGNLWVGTQKGLNKYLPETKSFQRFLNNPGDNHSLSNNTIRCLYEDKQGNIWVGTENGLNKLNKNGSFDRFFCASSFGAGLIHPIIKAIYQDKTGDIWVGSQGGIAVFSPDQKSKNPTTFFHDKENQNSISDDDVNSITSDFHGNVWIGTHFRGLNKFDFSNRIFKHYTTSNSGIVNDIIRKITPDKDGLLWIATLNGISVLDPDRETFTNHSYDPELPQSLNQNSIYDIYQDVANSVWVGTYYGGANVYHPKSLSFKVYQHYSYKNSLSSNIISVIEEDKQGNLWIGTEAEGLNYFNRKSGAFTTYRSGNGKNSLSSNLIKSISIDKNQNLWIAAYDGGVDFYDTDTRLFKNYKLSHSNTFSEKRVTSTLVDDSADIWVGTKGKGLFRYNRVSDYFEPLNNKNHTFFLPATNITLLYQDQKNTLWVATDEGLFYRQKGATKFSKVKIKDNSFFEQISVISETESGNLLFGSFYQGFAVYNPLSKKMKCYTVLNGLPSNTIASIVEDNQQRIWISTDKGIARLHNDQVKVYNKNDGLPGNVFNYHSVWKDSKGILFFGGYNGLVSFDPSQVSDNKLPPRIVFTDLHLVNKKVDVGDSSKVLPRSLNTIDKLVLSYKQNVFSIGFSVLNYVKPRKNSYVYKLEGFEDEWKKVSTPAASFTNLPAGTYNLLVKGSNNDGIFSTHSANLKIIIKPPFWRTWWAYLLYILVIAAVAYVVIRFFLIRASLKREHEAHQMKLDFFTNVSHEIRTPLTLILGPLEKIIQDTQDNLSLHKQLLIVNKNTKRLMKLVNELMDFRKIESGKMELNLSSDNIVPFLNEIYLSFQHLALQQKVEYSFKADQEFINVCFDKEQLETVILNLLSNAFKFTAKQHPKVSMEVYCRRDLVFICIKDNGKGVAEESKSKLFTDFYQVPNHDQRTIGTGIGLALAKKIAQLHQGDLVLEEDNSMTSFCLSLKAVDKGFNRSQISGDTVIRKVKPQFEQTIDNDFIAESTPKRSIVSNLPLLLVVEDNADVRDFIVKTLSEVYQIIEAENGKQALSLAFEKIPDVIISDVMMPEMDGFEFCAKIKTDIRTRHIPVVLLTARSSDLHELEGLKTGADVYLTKPFSPQKLMLITGNLVSLYQNMRDKFSKQFSLEPTNTLLGSPDEEFLNKVLQLLEENIANSEFNVNLFASEIGMSTPVFYKKIAALTGLTVNNFIKSVRLKRSLQLLQQKAGNISEIAYMVGFNDAKYFSKEFKKQYGKTPSAYL